MDRPIVLDQHHRLDGLPGLRTIEPVELLEMGEKSLLRCVLGMSSSLGVKVPCAT
jgi:hypothetical protein